MPIIGGNSASGSPIPRKLRTSDGDIITIGDISNGQYFQLSGTTLQGANVTTTGSLPICQVRRTTQITPAPTSFTDVTFDTVDVENVPATLERDDTNTDRILIHETGYYLLHYHFTIDDEANVRIRVNDTTVIPGSEIYTENDDSGDEPDVPVTVSCAYNLTAGDFVSIQTMSGTSAEFFAVNFTFMAIKLQGIKGDTGATGSGSTITVKDEGINVTSTPHSSLNFVGGGVTATDGGSGVATITIPITVNVQEEGSNVTGTPHSTLNFVGTGVTATNAGSGVATITVAPIFGANFEQASSTGTSTTTSSTFQTKLTHTTTSVVAGTYRIGWTFLWSHSANTSDIEVEVRVDSTQIWLMEAEPQDGDTNQRYSAAGFNYQTFGSTATHTLDIRYRSEGGTDTARIAEARLEFWRVS